MSFLRWIIGLQESPDWVAGGDWRIEFQALPTGAWAGISLLSALVAIWGVWFLYRKEGRTIGPAMRAVLVGVRLTILACIAGMLLEAVLVITKGELVPAHLLVLVDGSESMKLSDPYTDEGVAKKTAEQLELKQESGAPDLAALRKRARLDLAKQATSPLLEKLADGRILSVYNFAGKLNAAENNSLDNLKASGDTAIGDALNAALAAHRGQPMSGVLLVTDGQSNSGDDPRKIAEQAGKDNIPINLLAVGTQQGPSNAKLIEVEASPVVFVKDPVEISVLVESRGLKDHPATVTLEQRQDDGNWIELGREEVVLGEDAAVRRSTFKFVSDQVGQFEFRGRVLDVGPEVTEADNVASKSIKVVRQRIRTLLIAGYPSPEFQFIRNALLRDPGMEFSSWLQGAGDLYEQVGQRPLRRLPVNRREIEHYDVLVLFDPDMRQLGPEWSDLITRFVGDAGGGLIYVAGELNTQPLFATDSSSVGVDTAWTRSLPVVIDPGLYSSAAAVRLNSRETWNLELTGEGSSDPIFRFAPDPQRNREVLASLPGMYWHFPVTRAKPGATVLARHGDPRMRNNFGRHVLLAMQRYGPGRTVFIGFDSTYRWRYLHEEYFDGFWARMIDRLGRSKVLGGRYPFTLATDKTVYRTGDRVTMRLQMVGSEDTSVTPELRSEVELSGDAPLPLQFEPIADQAGALEASFTPEQAGAYTLRVVTTGGSPSPDGEGALRPATLNFKVEPPRQELDNPTLDRALLEDVAKASGGQVFTLADYKQVPATVKVRQVERVLEYRDEMWDAPLFFGLFLVLITGEWLLRKKYRMA